MKKLEDIPKNHPFQVPDRYFEELPLKIQSRISSEKPLKETTPYVRYALQYALPALVLVVVAFFFFRPETPSSAENMLASIDTEDLILYLEQTDITTDELLEEVNFSNASINAIEDEVYGDLDLNVSDEYIDGLLHDFELDSNNNF